MHAAYLACVVRSSFFPIFHAMPLYSHQDFCGHRARIFCTYKLKPPCPCMYFDIIRAHVMRLEWHLVYAKDDPLFTDKVGRAHS